MEKIKINFLKAIGGEIKTAIELCEELGIEPDINDKLGGYYNALLRGIHYNFEGKDELDGMFEIKNGLKEDCPNEDVFFITEKGKQTLEIIKNSCGTDL